MTVPMLKLTMAGSDAKPVWINPQHIAVVTKGLIIKGDAVVILKDGVKYDVTEKAKDIVDQMASLP